MAEHLYLHVPFCKSICYYCDFCHVAYNEKTADRWLNALEEEFSLRTFSKNLKTIYIGGGTPSSLDEERLERVLRLLPDVFPCSICIPANPACLPAL